MSYKIKRIIVDNSKLRVFVSFFDDLYSNTFEFSSDTSKKDILSTLDKSESLYQINDQMKDGLPDELKDLIGYTKE